MTRLLLAAALLALSMPARAGSCTCDNWQTACSHGHGCCRFGECCGAGPHPPECPGGAKAGSSASNPDFMGQAAEAAANAFMKGDVGKGFGAMGLGILGGAIQQSLSKPRTPRAAPPPAAPPPGSFGDMLLNRPNLEREKKEKADADRKALQSEWMSDDPRPAAGAKSPEASDELGFQWGSAKADPEFKPKRDDVAKAKDDFALQVEHRKFLRNALERARGRIQTGEIKKEEFERIQNASDGLLIPEWGGTTDKTVYRDRLHASLKETKAWLKDASGGPEDRCWINFDSASNACVDDGTVAGLRECYRLSLAHYNKCVTLAP